MAITLENSAVKTKQLQFDFYPVWTKYSGYPINPTTEWERLDKIIGNKIVNWGLKKFNPKKHLRFLEDHIHEDGGHKVYDIKDRVYVKTFDTYEEAETCADELNHKYEKELQRDINPLPQTTQIN